MKHKHGSNEKRGKGSFFDGMVAGEGMMGGGRRRKQETGR